jgi:hypothetical protein
MLRAIIDKLRQASDFQTEFDAAEFSLFREAYERFLAAYPPLVRLTDYLRFLQMTGGAFVDNRNYSLVIYGFGGDVAPSFDEPRLFLDRDRYFHFGDVVRPTRAGVIKVFAFDLTSDTDTVYVSDDGVWEYDLFADSFCRMLHIFVELGG